MGLSKLPQKIRGFIKTQSSFRVLFEDKPRPLSIRRVVHAAVQGFLMTIVEQRVRVDRPGPPDGAIRSLLASGAFLQPDRRLILITDDPCQGHRLRALSTIIGDNESAFVKRVKGTTECDCDGA